MPITLMGGVTAHQVNLNGQRAITWHQNQWGFTVAYRNTSQINAVSIAQAIALWNQRHPLSIPTTQGYAYTFIDQGDVITEISWNLGKIVFETWESDGWQGAYQTASLLEAYPS
ncbi:hypothetical protein TPY_1535 [Sulfobacillus acidophilus TPY]|nr:hypothetical protein TPY_1535 [Sulfobacillus acidophilus TPY]